MGKWNLSYLPVLLLCILCSCNESRKSGLTVHSVEVTSPVPADKTVTRNYPGVVKETHEISLGFKTAGQIERICVKDGDYVNKGELLAKLDDKDYKLGVETLQVQYNQLKDEVDRIKKLYEQKSVSANDFEKATAGLRQLEIQLQVNKNKLEYTSLYAPTDGYIQTVNFAPAEMVDAGTPVFTFLDISRMEVTADLPSAILKDIDNISEYNCRIQDSERSQTYPMDFVSISPRADGNQLYQLKLRFKDNHIRHLTPGMNIEVCITVNQDNDGEADYSIPMSSVFNRDGKPHVWILKEDSTVEKREINIRTEFSGRNAIVKEGLNGSESIVTSGVNVLRDGEKVIVIEKPEKSNVGGLI